MSFAIALREEPGQTRIVITGHLSLGQLASVMQLLQVDSASWRQQDVLLDLAGLEESFAAAEKDMMAHVARTRLMRKHVRLRWPGEKT